MLLARAFPAMETLENLLKISLTLSNSTTRPKRHPFSRYLQRIKSRRIFTRIQTKILTQLLTYSQKSPRKIVRWCASNLRKKTNLRAQTFRKIFSQLVRIQIKPIISLDSRACREGERNPPLKTNPDYLLWIAHAKNSTSTRRIRLRIKKHRV